MDFRSATSVSHVCTFAASSAAIIGVHSGLLSAMLPPAVVIDSLRLFAVSSADCNDVQASVTLPFDSAPSAVASKAAEISLADAVSGTSVLEKEESDTCGAQSQDRLIRTRGPVLHRLAVAGLQATGGGVDVTNRRLGRVERG